MVVPKNITKNSKKKPGDVKSKSPSPEPFQEPDGMTTIDLNKSDDYSRESELEKYELKRREQIKYVAQLLFALGSIFVIVILFIMMAFLNSEYHLFTIIPLKINQSYPLPTNIRSQTPNEEFLNITRTLNQEKFRQSLKIGKYAHQFPLEMDLCELFKSIEFCCDVFKDSDLKDMLEFCTVNDMLQFLIEYKSDSMENQQLSNRYAENWQEANVNSPEEYIDEESGNWDLKDTRNKRQLGYDPHFKPQLQPNLPLNPFKKQVDQQEYLDPYHDFYQFQPPEKSEQDPYQPLSQYQVPNQQPWQNLPSDNPIQYLQSPYIPNPENVKLTHPAPDLSLIMPNKYQFSESMVSDNKRSNHELPLKNSQDKPRLFMPQTIEQFESFGMGQQLGGDVDVQNRKQNIKPWLSLPYINSLPENENWGIGHQTVFPEGNAKVNKDISAVEIPDSTKLATKLQSVLMPLPERVREDILHHVTVTPKIEHVYKSSEFQSVDHFVNYQPENDDFKDPGRISNNDGRLKINHKLKVDAHGKFYIDDHQNSFIYKQKENIDHRNKVHESPVKSNLRKNSQPKHSIDRLRFNLNTEERNFPSQNRLGILGTSLDFNETFQMPQNSTEHNEEVDHLLGPTVLPNSISDIPFSNSERNQIEDSQIFSNNSDTNHTSEMAIEDFRNSFEEVNVDSKTTFSPTLALSAKDAIKTEDKEKLLYKSHIVLEKKNVDHLETSTEISAFYTTINSEMTEIKNEKELKTDYFSMGFKDEQTSTLPQNEDSSYDQTKPHVTAINNARAFSTDQEIFQKKKLRSSMVQDTFRGKQKPDTFTASEDTQSSQQTYINPCFNPYMSPYIPFMPPAVPPVKVGSTQETGYLKVVPVSQPHIQNQPMYVLNPSMFYGIPPTTPTYPSMAQNAFLPQGLFPQVGQSPYGGSYNSPVQVTSPGGQYYMCNPIPTPTNNIAGLAGVEVRKASSNLQGLMEGIDYFGRNNQSREATSLICPLGEQACLDNIKCIKNHHICDSEVHCDDSSDEIECTCRDRVGKLRLCDGYCDCPTCEDEQGCFGCEEDEYSCDDWSRFRRSTCVPISQRCDGIKQCEITGKDEMDCSILADHIGNFPLNKVSNAVGFLHRNYKGKWYPTCFGTELWAAQVCQVEAGPSAIIPKAHMTLTTDPYTGLFINILPNNKVSLVNTCVQDRAAFVECPPIYCGLRFLVNNPYRTHEVDTSIEDMLNDLERAYKLREDAMVGSSNEASNKTHDHNLNSLFEGDVDDIQRETRSADLRNNDSLKQEHLEEVIKNLERTYKRREISREDLLQQSRVVGGKPSQPAAWPWLVSIYKNGIFHCGGVLINELWIVTASHCVDRYWQYYYEIQAGALRRFSYSPMDQRRWATEVVAHEFYSKSNLRNDIALMKLSAPLRYNKFVRPICLPSEATAGQEFLKGPSPGSICTTVGWGATVEHGADPDHMREVEVPILPHCKHNEDSDVDEICAGLTDGGKDACQGDSGGPLMCRNPNNPNQWYLAGIVSHGEGCARPNEPGVYTKVSRYMGWLAENTRGDKLTVRTALSKCPGYVCKGTHRCVPKKRRCDRIIDCLLGDDEINCEDHFKQLFKHSRKSMTSSNTNVPSVTDDMLPNFEQLEEFGIVGSKPNETSKEKGEDRSTINKNNKTGMVYKQKSKLPEIYFTCQMLLQVVSINKRCNKVIDCEDGTDEFNCTCADYIKNVDPGAICDGVSDCPDLSDEAECVTCNNATEYTCRLAQKCIEASRRCDGIADCPQNEDEMNCASLTNGHTLTLDSDDRPMFKSRGLVTINHLGQWRPLCLNDSSLVLNDEPSIATAICNVLGFDDYFSYHKYLVENGTINNVTYSLRSGRVLPGMENKKCDKCCEGLYISCSNTSVSTTLQYKSLENVKELYFAPWIAAIYSNGHYKCMGTLLNQYWVVTSVKCFLGITILQGKYVVAVFGRGKINLSVKGPHEQIIRIVESVTVSETDIVLLRLEQDVKYNRYVQAANLNLRKEGRQIEKCYAIGQDNDSNVKFVPLSPIKNCLVGFRCFEKKVVEPCNNIYSWSGTIICDTRNGWYPAAVFNEEAGHCGLNHEKKYSSVKFYKSDISNIMNKTADPIPPPPCDGLLCNLGNCIPREKVCDGIVDCHSGEDEKSSLCYEKEKDCYTADDCVCPHTHLKCPTTNKCFPKSSFCDRANDCGEFEDEPDMCSCRNYLKLTDPDKICDGILHCLDRTDEDPNICTCKLDDFQCGKTNKCISQNMVCDDVKDCPNGEDEATCLSLNTQTHDRTNAGEVMTRTAGMWHTGCFDLNYSTSQLEDICLKLGFTGGSANQLTPPNNVTTLTIFRPVLDTFDVVWLRRQQGNKFKLRIRTGHEPYVKFVPDERCHRLFIACI